MQELRSTLRTYTAELKLKSSRDDSAVSDRVLYIFPIYRSKFHLILQPRHSTDFCISTCQEPTTKARTGTTETQTQTCCICTITENLAESEERPFASHRESVKLSRKVDHALSETASYVSAPGNVTIAPELDAMKKMLEEIAAGQVCYLSMKLHEYWHLVRAEPTTITHLGTVCAELAIIL